MTHIHTLQLEIPKHSPAWASSWFVLSSLALQTFVSPRIALLPNDNNTSIKFLLHISTHFNLTTSEETFHYFHVIVSQSEHVDLLSWQDFSLFRFKWRPAFSLSFFTVCSSFKFSLLSANRVVSSAYLRLFIHLPPIQTPASMSSKSDFHVM